jgi:hypothetical protein
MSKNIADISTFENIQNQANKSMGFSSSLSVFNGADPKKDVENEDDAEIENAIDAKREINAVDAKLKEVWQKFEEEKKRLDTAATKLKTAKQSNDTKVISEAADDYNLAKGWLITYAKDIETMQKDVAGLSKASEVTKKPALPKFESN